MENLKEMCLDLLSAELMVKKLALMTVYRWEQPTDSGSEQLMDLKTEKNSVCLMAESTAMQKVPLMDVGWVQLLELCLEQLMDLKMETSLDCPSGEPRAKLKGILLGCSMAMSLGCSLVGSKAIQKDLMMVQKT